MPIAVADAGGSQAHPNFTGLGLEQFDVFDDEGAPSVDGGRQLSQRTLPGLDVDS